MQLPVSNTGLFQQHHRFCQRCYSFTAQEATRMTCFSWDKLWPPALHYSARVGKCWKTACLVSFDGWRWVYSMSKTCDSGRRN